MPRRDRRNRDDDDDDYDDEDDRRKSGKKGGSIGCMGAMFLMMVLGCGGFVLVSSTSTDRSGKNANPGVAKTAESEPSGTNGKKQNENNPPSQASQIKANKNLPRDQFRALVSGRTRQQVLDVLGKPDETQDIEGLGECWYYSNASVDPITKKKAFVQLAFDGGVVSSVNFN